MVLVGIEQQPRRQRGETRTNQLSDNEHRMGCPGAKNAEGQLHADVSSGIAPSQLKDFAPLADRDVRLTARVSF